MRNPSNINILDTVGLITYGASEMYVWSVMMLGMTLATTEEFRPAAIVDFMQ